MMSSHRSGLTLSVPVWLKTIFSFFLFFHFAMLYSFQVCTIVTQQFHMLSYAHQDQDSQHLSPHNTISTI